MQAIEAGLAPRRRIGPVACSRASALIRVASGWSRSRQCSTASTRQEAPDMLCGLSSFPASDRAAKPMRILMTSDAVGGVWTYSLKLARTFAAFGIEIFLATMGTRPNVRQRADVDAIPNLTLLESDFRLEWMEDPWPDVDRAGEWLLELERQISPDIVHLNGY